MCQKDISLRNFLEVKYFRTFLYCAATKSLDLYTCTWKESAEIFTIWVKNGHRQLAIFNF